MPFGRDAEATPAVFATTHWTAVLAARDETEASGAVALEGLCRIYWPPIYAYIRRRGHTAEEAQDLTQEFFFRLLDRKYLSQVDPGKGRFRSFLLVAVNHFLANERDRVRAVKRGGRVGFVSLEEAGNEEREFCDPAAGLSPERAYDQRWALAVIDRVVLRLRGEQEHDKEVYSVLEPLLMGEKPAPQYAELAEKFGTTEAALKMKVHRLRRRFGVLLREEILPTVSQPEEVEDELRELFQALQGG